VTPLRSLAFCSLAGAVAWTALACGGNTSSSNGAAQPPPIDSPAEFTGDAGTSSDAPASSPDAPSTSSDSASPADAAGPACPAVYSVYGDLDASDNLGMVNPTLYASGKCSGPLEQSSGLDAGPDGDISSTDLEVTLTQSAPRSGMFVTHIHQTTPFAFDYTTCLESAGHGTGSLPQPGAGDPGTMALVNDPEMPFFPQVQLDTNLAGNDLVFDVSLSDTAMFTLNTVSCTFVKN
jgi:hypothetical protein